MIFSDRVQVVSEKTYVSQGAGLVLIVSTGQQLDRAIWRPSALFTEFFHNLNILLFKSQQSAKYKYQLFRFSV